MSFNYGKLYVFSARRDQFRCVSRFAAHWRALLFAVDLRRLLLRDILE